jgi:glutaredoxin
VSVITLYSHPDCGLCDDALGVLVKLQRELEFDLRQQDITADERLHRAYFERVPVVALDGDELFEYFVDEAVLRERLESRR